MTRKRFVKLLMARGYGRNEANYIANTGKMHRPYAERYMIIVLSEIAPETFDHLRATLQDVLQQIAEAARVVAECLVIAVREISESAPGIIENMRRLQAADEGKDL